MYGVIVSLNNLVPKSGNVGCVAMSTTVAVTVMGFGGVELSPDAASTKVADAFISWLWLAVLGQAALLVVGIFVTMAKCERPKEAVKPTSQWEASVTTLIT